MIAKWTSHSGSRAFRFFPVLECKKIFVNIFVYSENGKIGFPSRKPRRWDPLSASCKAARPTGAAVPIGFAKQNIDGDSNPTRKPRRWLALLLRRRWDSNPRNAFTFTRFPSVLLKPLGHLSTKRRRFYRIALSLATKTWKNHSGRPCGCYRFCYLFF